MGIRNLLSFLSDYLTEVYLESLKGKVVGIDAYIWLYKGTQCCPYQIAMELPCDDHIRYVVRRVEDLVRLKIRPVLVFDGCVSDMKCGQNQMRRKVREEYRNKGKEALARGDRASAIRYFKQCTSICHDDAVEAMKRCRNLGIDCIVAPFESDSQLTYLQKIGLIDYIITEDSDMLVFGAPHLRKLFIRLILMLTRGSFWNYLVFLTHHFCLQCFMILHLICSRQCPY